MDAAQIHRVSGRIMVVLSVVALLAVLAGFTQAPQADEGAAAHVFQITMVALAGLLLVFLATVDRRQPLRSTRLLAVPATVLALAFAALYYLEHHR